MFIYTAGKKCNTLKDCVHWHRGIIMCILRGCRLVLVIHLSRSQTIRWHSGGLSLRPLSCSNNSGVFRGECCNIHSRIQPCPSDEYVLLLNNISHLHGVTLQACAELDGHVAGLLSMLGTVYQWCVAAFSSGLWNIPTPVDKVLDGRTSRSTHFESSGGRPKSIQGRNLSTCCT